MGSQCGKVEMRAIILFIFCRLGLIFCRAWQDACATPEGVSPSPSSCSSYLSCNQVGQVRVMQCEEGMLWNEEEKFCDWKENVSCWKDVIWFIKAGLRFLNIAGRVTKNLVDSENVDRLAMLTKNERGDNSRKLDSFHVDEESYEGDRATEDISKYVTMKHATYEGSEPETETEILDEEGSGYLLNLLSSTSRKKDNENEKNDGETEPAILSEAFKQLFFDQNDATETWPLGNLTSVKNAVEKGSGLDNSLPWININWVPNTTLDKQ